MNYLPISLNIVVQILANVDAMVFAHTIFDYHNKPWEVLHRLGHKMRHFQNFEKFFNEKWCTPSPSN